MHSRIMVLTRNPNSESGAAADSTGAEPGMPEAGARQRRGRHRKWVTIGIAALVAAGIFGGVRLIGRTSSPAAGEGGVALTAGVFAGTWHIHTYSITFGPNGRGFARWAIHVNCTGPDHGLPPCDKVVRKPVVLPGGRTVYGDYITDGGHANVTLTSRIGNTARGYVQGSNVQSVLPNGPATFRVGANDLLYISLSRPTGPSPFGHQPFCGARAGALSLAQQLAANISCGA
ncbi:MAG: hypothetical protein ACRD0E_07445 [Acidimicrobiales bacterium]